MLNLLKPDDDSCAEMCVTTETSLLRCLQRPDFFRGQHLTAEDLDAIIEWTRGRLRLQRLRESWGVVCGLQVTVDSAKTLLRVSPGYAVDPCGEDIVACKQLTLDFRNHCKCTPHDLETPKGDDLRVWLDAIEKQGTEFDLSIHFAERKTDPRLASIQGCAPTNNGSCRHARWLEDACLSLKPRDDGEPKKESKRENLVPAIEKLIEANPKLKDKPAELGEMIQRWLLAKIDKLDGLRQPALRELVRTIDAELLSEVYVKIARLLEEDAKNRLELEDCHSCDPEAGVHLARVWLKRIEQSPCCIVTKLDLDDRPNFRNDRSSIWPPADVYVEALEHGETNASEATASNIDSIDDRPIEDLTLFNGISEETVKLIRTQGYGTIGEFRSLSADELNELKEAATNPPMAKNIEKVWTFLQPQLVDEETRSDGDED